MSKMGFNFNPTLWFVCRFCRRLFADTETLKEHKLACHLGECMGIKCIVFEERLLKEEWMPDRFSENSYAILNESSKKTSFLKNDRNAVQIVNNSTTDSSFKNPTVLLTRSTEQEINSSFHGNSSSHECQGGKIEESSENSIPSDEEIQLKIEFPSYDESTHGNSVGNEDNCTDLDDVKDREFIVASVSSNSDGVPQVQFASTLISVSPRVYQLYRANADFNTTVTIAELEHQEMVSNKKASGGFNSNTTNALRTKTDVTELNPAANGPQQIIAIREEDPQTNEPIKPKQKEPEQRIEESYQQQPSTSLGTCHSRAVNGIMVKNSFMCETCSACFRTKHQLKQHEVCHSSIKPFKCSKCAYKFKFKGHLKRHQVVHGQESKFKCRFCNKYFGQNCHLVDHERIHTGEKPFKCSVAQCFFAASSKTVLTAHTRARHGSELGFQQYVCPTCGNTYGLKKALHAHIRIRHGNMTQVVTPSRGAS